MFWHINCPMEVRNLSFTHHIPSQDQLEKEGPSCSFRMKNLMPTLFGHPFNLITDQMSFLSLLNKCKSSSPQASAIIKRWSLYNEYKMKFCGTKSHSIADALSHLLLSMISPGEGNTTRIDRKLGKLTCHSSSNSYLDFTLATCLYCKDGQRNVHQIWKCSMASNMSYYPSMAVVSGFGELLSHRSSLL